MVKIRKIPFIVGIVMFVLLMSAAYAQSKLIFSDVDVKVGSRTSKNLEDRDTIDDEASPGDTIEFRVEVRNNFTNEEDLKIEDITVQVTVEEIDDGDDLDEESSEFDLRQGSDKRINLKFEVPIEVEEDSFDVLIHAEGEDENGTSHEADMALRLDVDKETHLLKITRAALNPAEISCSRRSVQLGTSIVNIGNDDEPDIKVSIINSELGININEDIGELTAEPHEPESKFSKTYLFNVPADAEAGSYPITLRVLYDGDREKAEETPTLTISDCATANKQTPSTEEKGKDSGVEVITPPPTTGSTTSSGGQPAAPGVVVTQESLLKSNTFFVGIIIAEIVVVIIGIVLIASLIGRRS